MHIVKSLHAGVLHNVYQFDQKNYFTVSALWAFNLDTGEPLLEHDFWSVIGEVIEINQMFDAGKPKTTGEFLVHGKCHPPGGVPANASRVFVRVGDVSKELNVFGDRHWIKGLGVGWGVSEPETFSEMDVSYQNAFGGKEYPQNPIGKGIDEADVDGESRIALPNIEYPDQLVGSPKDRPAPASLNRVDITWDQRSKKSGTYDQKYIEERMPGFPDDLNLEYFNDAAEDQWSNGYFSGNENYEILNMHPENSRITGQLPPVKARCFVTHEVDGNGVFKEIDTVLDTIWLLPGENIGVLLHRGTIEVAEDDAADIKKILIAHESFEQQVSEKSYYEEQLEKRTNPEVSYKYLMYTAPLIPEGCRCGFDIINEKAGIDIELLGKENMEVFADNKQSEMEALQVDELEKARAQIEELGPVDKAHLEQMELLKDIKESKVDDPEEVKRLNALLEKILPGITTDPKNPDLSKLDFDAFEELKRYSEDMAKSRQDEAEALIKENIETLRQNEDLPELDNTLSELEASLVGQETLPVLPRLNLQEEIDVIEADLKKQLEEQRHIMRSQGVAETQLDEMDFDMSAIKAQLADAAVKFIEGYRIGAHYTKKMASPHEGMEQEILDSLLESYRSGKKTSEGDYAFVDFSNLDLTGIDLSGSFLEYAIFDNTDLSGANLSNAILSNAVIINSTFTDAVLEGANIGNVSINGASFKNADLSGAVLARSRLKDTIFEKCRLPEKQDMFLETEFEKTSFLDCEMTKNNFIDVDISECDFTGTDLSGSNFVNPVMTRSVFRRGNLAGVNFVAAQADAAIFDHAEMKNVRFVGECSLDDTSFESASLPEANLRDCSLRRADFSHAVMTRSDFGGSDMSYAKLERADARLAQFNKADMTHAVFQHADMMDGSLYKAKLSGARFLDANLYSVNFLGCTVGQTDFTGAYLEQTIFKDWSPSS